MSIELNLDCERIEYDPVGDVWYCKELGQDITDECQFCGVENAGDWKEGEEYYNEK